MVLLLALPAFALDADIGLGTQLVTNDPFDTPIGAQASVLLRPVPWLGAGLSFGGYPVSTAGTLATRLLALGFAADVSRIRMSADVYGDVRFARGKIGPFDGSVDLLVGVGGVYTEDDCAAIQAEANPACAETANQLHPASVLGLAASVGRGQWGLRLRGERWQYTEVIVGEVDEKRIPVWFGADVVFRLGGG